jgi:Ca2+/Na+ antiporter
LILLLVSIVIATLIAYEQISVLYVLCTLVLVTLLLIVGFSNLEAVGRTDTESKS